MGKTPLQHTYDAKVSAGATVQERCSLPGDTKQQKSGQRLEKPERLHAFNPEE